MRGLSLVAASGGHSSSHLHRSARASLVAEHRLQTHRLSDCGSRAQPLRGMWDLPRPGLEPTSPALAGRFSTTVPPGKPSISFYSHSISLLLLSLGQPFKIYEYPLVGTLFKMIYLFIYFWLHWVFIAARGLSLVVSWGYSSLRCTGFSLQWLLLLRSTGSRAGGLQ